jgi:hypothetical protein
MQRHLRQAHYRQAEHCHVKQPVPIWSYLLSTGTAMGTPPASMYATLYYDGIHELQEFRPKFKSLLFYTQYIDDIFGIWIMDDNADTDVLNWNNFQDMLKYGKLTWLVSE